MNVRDLMKILAELDGDRLVVLSGDGEGNKYSPLSEPNPAVYVPECAWEGDVYAEEAVIFGSLDEDAVPEGSVPCLVLYPEN